MPFWLLVRAVEMYSVRKKETLDHIVCWNVFIVLLIVVVFTFCSLMPGFCNYRSRLCSSDSHQSMCVRRSTKELLHLPPHPVNFLVNLLLLIRYIIFLTAHAATKLETFSVYRIRLWIWPIGYVWGRCETVEERLSLLQCWCNLISQLSKY